LVLAVVLTGASVAVADPRIGDPAPALDVATVDGTPLRREAGRVTVVDFFATWCEPCIAALGKLDQMAHELGSSVSFVVVDVQESPETVRAFFAAHPPPPGARVGLDLDGAASARWGQHRLPTTFVVDAGGVIRFINRGYGPGYGDRVAARIKAALAGGREPSRPK
jgi:thiol-disulfide isomerase/thioredoxin